MFDPTAYDNMKVVIEGAVYDLDIEGRIKMVDRKDIVDLATLSRMYEITYRLNHPTSSVFAKLSLDATLVHLASELLPESNQKQIGALVHISFSWNEHNEKYMEMIKHHWGLEHNYDERQINSSLHGVREEVIIDFSRIITEEMIDDLLEMFHYSVDTLEKLK